MYYRGVRRGQPTTGGINIPLPRLDTRPATTISYQDKAAPLTARDSGGNFVNLDKNKGRGGLPSSSRREIIAPKEMQLPE